jgi:hypothetical protein
MQNSEITARSSKSTEISNQLEDHNIQDLNKLPSQERKEIYKLWIRQCSTRIVSKIFYQEYLFMRLFWIVFLIFSSCISFYITIKYLRNYLSYDTIISIDYDYVYESPTHFPAITICNLNPLYRPRAEPFVKSVLELNNITKFI